jgi:hypothetical protein
MASILRTTSLLIEENKEHEVIPQEETELDFNFYKDEGAHDPLKGDPETEFGIDKYVIEQASQSAYYEVNLINEEEEKEQQIEKEEQQIEQKVEEKAKKEPPIEEPQIVQPQIVTRKERRQSQVMRDIEEQKLEDQALKEQQKQAKLKKKTLIPQNLDISNLSQVSGIDDGSGDTSANRLIIDNIRLETYNATSQAMTIYGNELRNFIQPESPCALCGFPLQDRISYIHNRTHNYNPKQLTWSYDHFVPVNFAAVMFRIVTSQGNYEPKELNLLKDNGYIVCYHCNYEKSQRLFVTCKKTDGKTDFRNFEPNTKTITKFVNDLYKSTNKHGWADKDGNRTLIKCLAPPNYYKTWIRERIEAIEELARKVCVNIISQVDFEAVKQRLIHTKSIIRKAQSTVLDDYRFKELKNQKSKNRFKREYIARLFAAAELNFLSPWKWKQTNTNSGPSPVPATARALSPATIIRGRSSDIVRGPAQPITNRGNAPLKSRPQGNVRGLSSASVVPNYMTPTISSMLKTENTSSQMNIRPESNSSLNKSASSQAPVTAPALSINVPTNKKRKSSIDVGSPRGKTPKAGGSSRKRKNKRKTYRGVRLF